MYSNLLSSTQLHYFAEINSHSCDLFPINNLSELTVLGIIKLDILMLLKTVNWAAD